MKIEVVYTCDCGVTTVKYIDALVDETFIECFICRSRRFRLTPVVPDRAEARDGEDDSSTEVLCGRTD